MPFNVTTGVYTPPAGATNAITGQVIQSVIWNSIHADLSAALTQIGEDGGLYPVGVLAFAHSVVLTSTGDAATLIPIVPASVIWTPSQLYFLNVGAAPATIAYGIFTGAGATGTTIVPVTNFTLAAAGVGTVNGFSQPTPANLGAIALQGGTNLFFRVATVQAAGTVSMWVRGQVLP